MVRYEEELFATEKMVAEAAGDDVVPRNVGLPRGAGGSFVSCVPLLCRLTSLKLRLSCAFFPVGPMIKSFAWSCQMVDVNAHCELFHLKHLKIFGLVSIAPRPKPPG